MGETRSVSLFSSQPSQGYTSRSADPHNRDSEELLRENRENVQKYIRDKYVSSDPYRAVRIILMVIGVVIAVWGIKNYSITPGVWSTRIGAGMFIAGVVWSLVRWYKEKGFEPSPIKGFEPSPIKGSESSPIKGFEPSPIKRNVTQLTPQEATTLLFTALEQVGNFTFSKKDQVRLLIQQGANVNAVNNDEDSLHVGKTPIDIAFEPYRDKELVQILLQHGAITKRQEILDFAKV